MCVFKFSNARWIIQKFLWQHQNLKIMEYLKIEVADDSGVSGNGYGSSGSSPASVHSPDTVNSRSSGNDTMVSPLHNRSPTYYSRFKQSNIYQHSDLELSTFRAQVPEFNSVLEKPHRNKMCDDSSVNNFEYFEVAGDDKKKEKMPPVRFITIKSNGLIEMICPLTQFFCHKMIYNEVQNFSEHLLSHCERGMRREDRPEVLSRIVNSIDSIIFKKSNKKKSNKSKNASTNESVTNDVRTNSFEPNRDDEMRIDSHVPQISKGTIRVIPCKSCKVELFLCKAAFWIHLAEVHFKNEKMFKCNLCAFVTQYRHHNEYHSIKHKGEKPLKCKYDNCNYHCENQAMLVSHHKSHLQFATFFCGSCEYKSKYITPYKHHLVDRKHQVGYALNDDGTPVDGFNIDPHSTKRGPKTKKLKSVSSSPIETTVRQEVDVPDTQEVIRSVINTQSAMAQKAMYEWFLYNETMKKEAASKKIKENKKQKKEHGLNDPLDLTMKKMDQDIPVDLCKPSTSGTHNKRKGHPVKCTSQQFDSEEDESTPAKKRIELYKCPWNLHGCSAVFGNAEFTQQHFNCHGLDNPLVCIKCNAITSSFQQFCDHLALKGLNH